MLGCSLYFPSAFASLDFDFSTVCLKVFQRYGMIIDYLPPMMHTSGGAIMQETMSIWIASVCWMPSSHLIVLWWMILWDIKWADRELWCSSYPSYDGGISLIVEAAWEGDLSVPLTGCRDVNLSGGKNEGRMVEAERSKARCWWERDEWCASVRSGHVLRKE